MHEDIVRMELQQTLLKLGFNPIHEPDGARTVRSRPDIYCLSAVGPSSVFEVKRVEPPKTIEAWFSPLQIQDTQRQWLDWWVFGRGGHGFICICFLTKPRRYFVVPWQSYVSTEKFLYEVLANENSKLEKPQPFKLGISEFEKLPKSYELDWVPGTNGTKGGWKFREGHPVLSIPVKPHPAKGYHIDPVSFRFENKESE